MDLQALGVLLGGLILAGVLWIAKATQENTTSIAVLTASIDNHVMPDLTRLQTRADTARDLAQTSLLVAERLDERVVQAERGINELWKVKRSQPKP